MSCVKFEVIEIIEKTTPITIYLTQTNMCHLSGKRTLLEIDWYDRKKLLTIT
jgi:hypothetical protein